MSVLPQTAHRATRQLIISIQGCATFFFFLFLLFVQGCLLPLFFSSTVCRGSLVPAWKINEKIQPVPTTITDISWKEKPKIRTWRNKNTVSGLSSRKVPAFFIRMRCLDGVQAQKSLSTCLAPALISLSGFSPHQKKNNNLDPRAFLLKPTFKGKALGMSITHLLEYANDRFCEKQTKNVLDLRDGEKSLIIKKLTMKSFHWL